MNNEIKLGDIVVFNIGDKTFDIIGKYIVSDDRLWRVDAITENDPPTPDRNRKYRLVAVDCPNVMLDEIPEIYIESYSEKLERELEEQRKEALKMNRNEIKQGDRVRVSKDAPELYTMYGQTDWESVESTVEKIDGDAAEIRWFNENSDEYDYIAIPIKYLVKVEAEAKEAKIDVGDEIRIKVGSLTLQGVLLMVSGDIITIMGNGEQITSWRLGQIDHMELIEKKKQRLPKFNRPQAEPTEQTEAEEDARIRQMEAELDEFRKAELDKMLHPEKYYTYEVTIDNVAMNWQRYAADIAKEVALKVANRYNDPKEAAEYAVSVAKAVVEGLKRK